MTGRSREREELARAVVHELLDGLHPRQREVVESLLRGAEAVGCAPRHGKAHVERIIRDLHGLGLMPRYAPRPAPFVFVEDPLPPWPPLPPDLSEATINHLRMGPTGWEEP